MYSKEFTNEIMQYVKAWSDRMNKLTFEVYDDKFKHDTVIQYEKLVPELRDYRVSLNEDSIMKLISWIELMLQYFNPAPAAKTRIIKEYVSEEKMVAYSMILKGSFDETKAYLNAILPEIIDKRKEEFARSLLDKEMQMQYKFIVIRKAQRECMKNGKISMSKAIRDYLKTHTGEDVFDPDEEAVERLKNFMSNVNKFFEWICEHENDILKEVAFYKSKEELLKATIMEKYSDPTTELPDHPTMKDSIVAMLKEGLESPNFKYTQTYDEYLESLVNELISAFGGTTIQ